MYYFLDYLEPFKDEAVNRFQQGERPRDIHFSNSTYQISFLQEQGNSNSSERNLYWVFIQLDSQRKQIKDIFCSCPSCQDESISENTNVYLSHGCIHMALAFCNVLQGGDRRPLHNRFYSSSHFHTFFYALSKRNGKNKAPQYFEMTERDSSTYAWRIDADTEIVVEGSPSDLHALRSALVMYKEEETEENSIKFSDLSEKELHMWRCGNPTAFLSYELSPLSELAKWLFLQSIYVQTVKKKKPSIKILLDEENSSHICGCVWQFSETLRCSLKGMLPHEGIELLEGLSKERHLFDIFPDVISTSQIDLDSLAVYSAKKGKKERVFCSCIPYSIKEAEKQVTTPIFPHIESSWRITQNNTLIFKELDNGLPLGNQQEIFFEDPHCIEEFLEMYAEGIKNELYQQGFIKQDICVQKKRKEVIVKSICEIFSHNNKKFQIEIAHMPLRIGRWIFFRREESADTCEKLTLLRVSGFTSVPYPEIHVTSSSVNDFLTQHKLWLRKHPGFQIHSTSESLPITYKVDTSTGALIFLKNLQPKTVNDTEIKKLPSEFCDLGDWVWRQGSGFFPNKQQDTTTGKHYTAFPPSRLAHATTYQGIPLEVLIPPHRVMDLIHRFQDTFTALPQFFCKEIPIKETGLKISYEIKKRTITIALFHSWKSIQQEKETIYYGEYGYLPGKGFFRVPVLSVQGLTPRIIEMTQKDEWDQFFTNQLPYYINEYPCHVDPRLMYPASLKLFCKQILPQEVSASLENTTNSDFLIPTAWKADFFWKSEKGEITFSELTSLIEYGCRFIPTNAGCIDLGSDRFLWVRSYLDSIKTVVKKTKGIPSKRSSQRGTGIYLKTYDVLRIQAHDQFEFEPDEISTDSAISSEKLHPISIIHRILQCSSLHPPDTKFLNSELRPYQKTGLEWLWFLYTSGLSGLLCDDMGVGKTHQAMALFAAVFAHHISQDKRCTTVACEKVSVLKRNGPRFLVICPTSLVWHWKEKLEKFLPRLNVFCYFGVERSREGIEDPWNVFLTTYGIWRNEVSFLRQIHFEVAVFDELQIAKNHVSLVWASLAQVQARMRLGLTGTPIENQLRELKSLFDLVLPGYFPDESMFRDLYVRPIERANGHERKSLLARAIAPFVLRRRKEDVLPELPAKTEEFYVTELALDQKVLYKQIASLQGVPLIHQLQDHNQPIPYMHIFALLAALKQICNHPACYLKEPSKYKEYESGKWLVFQELIEEARESRQKIVVFSQYLTMLDIMGLYLRESGIGYTEIRGGTRHRGKAIDKFRDDPTCCVFLGSLQAAGLGIDLTPASIVIHYDRWWNAARENQATDRVHRLGQSCGVQVIKMMTKNTVEERIDQMITRKASLLEEVVNYDDHQIVKKMSREELLEILTDIETL